PQATTPPVGVKFDAAPLQSGGFSLPVQRLATDGMQAAWHMEACMRHWLAPMRDAVTSPALRGCLAEMLGERDAQMERLQRAMAAFGVSHDDPREPAHPPAMSGFGGEVPGGPLLDLAAALVAHTEQARLLSAYDTLEPVAAVSSASEAAPHLAQCAASARQAVTRLGALCRDRLVPDAAQAEGPPLPCDLIHRIFGVSPGGG
ncbi:MAG TPA: DUF892 family protein, partial [Acetobacteraceae bacterium]